MRKHVGWRAKIRLAVALVWWTGLATALDPAAASATTGTDVATIGI